MRTIKNLGLAASMITVMSLSACAQGNKPDERTIATNGKGFAVLELFTSEGCSSCPPADALLARIQRETNGKPVYVLAYHVDYWNRLGWKDIFSSADFSKRQAQYGNWLNAQIYTPQLVVNGKTEFIGSDESAIRNTIATELAADPVTNLQLHVHQDGQTLKLRYLLSAPVKESRVLIALVQKNAQTKVERGENAGHTLSHVQIVRKLQNEQLKANGDGNTVVELPAEFDSQTWEVLGLIQDPNTGKILAAARAQLHSPTDEKNK
jgi:hypothetical protein